MIALLRLAGLLFVVLTVIYVSVSLYDRSLRRERLEKRWDSRHTPGPLPPDRPQDRAEFIARGLSRYDRSVRRRLLLLVYVIPLTVIAFLVWIVNYA
ncbi:MAG: hypothetical protein KJZ85_09135 [Rhodobacteraceae bacterium]|jgi:hypothetical protein|nr:hypothetical protein [Paracoccaceae bacterium]